jgi:aldehyde:ferredoxin oxidoreductase
MPQFDYEIAKVVNYLESAFGVKLAEEQFKVYVKSLGHVNIIKLQAAAERIVRENVYFPKVAEIMRAVDLIPDRLLSSNLMTEHQRKAKLLKDRFYRTREIDRSGFDGLYQELREAGYWAKAEFVRELEGRFEGMVDEAEGERLKVEG